MLKCLFALIPFVISIILFINGISTINQSRDIEVPKMGEPNWFEIKNQQTDLEMSGIAMTVFGIFFFIITVVVFLTIFTMVKSQKNGRGNFTSQVSEMMKKGLEEAKEERNPHVKCDYCGATYLKTEIKCPGCGARNRSKK